MSDGDDTQPSSTSGCKSNLALLYDSGLRGGGSSPEGLRRRREAWTGSAHIAVTAVTPAPAVLWCSWSALLRDGALRGDRRPRAGLVLGALCPCSEAPRRRREDAGMWGRGGVLRCVWAGAAPAVCSLPEPGPFSHLCSEFVGWLVLRSIDLVLLVACPAPLPWSPELFLNRLHDTRVRAVSCGHSSAPGEERAALNVKSSVDSRREQEGNERIGLG